MFAGLIITICSHIYKMKKLILILIKFLMSFLSPKNNTYLLKLYLI